MLALQLLLYICVPTNIKFYMNVHLIAITLWTMWSCLPTTKLRRLVKIILLQPGVPYINERKSIVISLNLTWPDQLCMFNTMAMSKLPQKNLQKHLVLDILGHFGLKYNDVRSIHIFPNCWLSPFSEKVISKYPGKTTQTYS